MKKERTKKDKKIIAAVFVLAVLFMLGKGIAEQPQIIRNEDEIAELQAQIEYETKRMEEVDALKEKVNTDEYIEKVAREKLGLVKNDEIIFVDISGE